MCLLGLLELLPALITSRDKEEGYRSVFPHLSVPPELPTAGRRNGGELASLTSAVLSYRAVNNRSSAFSLGHGLQLSGQTDLASSSSQQTQHFSLFSHSTLTHRVVKKGFLTGGHICICGSNRCPLKKQKPRAAQARQADGKTIRCVLL